MQKKKMPNIPPLAMSLSNPKVPKLNLNGSMENSTGQVSLGIDFT
eukprot:CAMPEP_0202975034 /NCGR_PEP_ID=MMETSP1396-20130829/65911_1 /ASSEMBLY_ACC=CAM_ASM_000872 /TAXON_ID= /ORGANISM="Pseudokeronopsis sp., Strain Brazil" /LENGTH=44 /DNA_ID= /DNA_START= /DNA_END= /DNA_ORIENTATION=